MHQIISQIEQDLKNAIDLKHKEQTYKFFKEEIKQLGVKTPIVRKIAAKYFTQVKKLDKQELFELCEQLASREREFQVIAFDWLNRIKKKFEPSDFAFFEKIVKNHISNWAACDDFCTNSFGYFIFQFPEFTNNLKLWAKSNNRWVRRASAVSLIYSLRKKQNLEQALEIAQILLQDKDDLVQKGYGWMLKQGTKHFEKEIVDFVMQRKDLMPRTAFRYAIENLKKPAKIKLLNS